jgi:lysophospholipase L1-like esterase
MKNYLALGDSYTIGEQVPPEESFPLQTVELLRRQGILVAPPRIIATTGWTTDELLAAVEDAKIGETYSLVTLLIGVNNQYRGRDVENYEKEFSELLSLAVQFAGGDENRVVVLSIPDWGITPFAQDRDRGKIAQEIDAYNEAAQKLTFAAGAYWIDITDSTREHGTQEDWLAPDGLHPGGKEYAVWAGRLAPVAARILEA